MNKQEREKQEIIKQECIRSLHELLKPGDYVYYDCSNVNRQGTARDVRLFIVSNDYEGKPRINNITSLAARALGYKLDGIRYALRVRGGGMNMGFHVIYSLGRAMFPDGFKLGPANRHRNGDPSDFDKDGGYAFNYEAI